MHNVGAMHPLCDQHATVCWMRKIEDLDEDLYRASKYLCIVYKLQYRAGGITNTEVLSRVAVSQ